MRNYQGCTSLGAWSKAFRTIFSELVSNAEVTSSNNKIFGLRTSAACNGDPLLLTTWKSTALAGDHSLKTIGETHDEVVDVCVFARLGQFVLCNSFAIHPQEYVFTECSFEQSWLFADQRNERSVVHQLDCRYVHTIEIYRSSIWIIEPFDQRNDGRFSATACAD